MSFKPILVSTHLPSDVEPLIAVDAFRSERDVLTDLLQLDLPNIATKLYSKSIISAAAVSEALNQTHTAFNRTVSLLSVVEDKIRAEPHVFTEFVKILESEPTLSVLASRLVENYLDLPYGYGITHREVISFIRELDTTRLYELGGALGLNIIKLKGIASSELPLELCERWLRGDDAVYLASGTPTWSSLVRAVRSIGANSLANRIERERKTLQHPGKSMKDYNIGEILQMKKDTPRYAALKKHESELIEALPEDVMVSLARSAFKYTLVPMEVVSRVQSLDPSIIWPHPLICRYLFFHVYDTIMQARVEKSCKLYKDWLKLLSDLNVADVSGVLFRIKQSESWMESIIASRNTPSGGTEKHTPSREVEKHRPSVEVEKDLLLQINDIPVLAKNLSVQQFDKCNWKQLIYSIPLSDYDISRLLSERPLEQLLQMWASKFPDASIESLQTSLYACSGVNLDITKLVSSSNAYLRARILEKHGRIDESNCGALRYILEEYSATLMEYANCLLLPHAEAQWLTNAIRIMGPEACLTTVLTMWVKNKFHHARLPTFKNLVKILSGDDKAKLEKRLMLDVIDGHGFGFEIESVWPSCDLGVIEGKSALLEIQVSCAADCVVDFSWWLENAGISHSISRSMITNRFYCLGVVIVHVDANSLEMEGAYKCTVKNVTTEKRITRIIQLTVKTPLDEYRNKLTAFHSEQPEVPKDTWPPVSIESYINLALIKQEHITAPNYHTIRGDVDDILSDKEAIVYKAVFDNLDSSTRLLVEGRPGSGKTTLVHKASKDWASGYLKFPHNRLLFLVHLRAFSSNPDVSLHDIIRCYPYSDSAISTISEYVERHNGLGLCFILDGLDEYNPGNDSCFIFRLIRHEIFPKAVIIIASRPSAAADIRHYASKQVEVIGFRTQQIYEYVARYPFSEASCDQLCQYLGQHPRVINTCYLPIHCAMVCCLFNFLKGSLSQTETEIYEEFTKYMILRTLYRGSKSCRIKSLDDLPPSPKGVFNKICRLAYEMTVKSKQAMEEIDIKFFFDVKEYLGLLTVDQTATRLGFQNMYTFLHLTAQEYLAAYYISKLDDKEQLKVINEYSNQNQMQQVWKFYCGLAPKSNVDSSQHKFAALIGDSKYGTLYKVQCCFESQSSYVCDAAVDDNSLSFTENFLSSSNFEEVAYVLSNTKHNTVKKLSFDGCSFGKEEVTVLLKKLGNKKIASVTTLCYHQCSTEQWDVIKYLVHSLSSLEVLDVSHSHIQLKKEIYDFFEKLNHPNIKRIQISSVGCVLHSVRDLNLMLVEESTDTPYHVFPYSISADEVVPVKVLSRELLKLHSELPELYKNISNIVVFKNVFSANNSCIYELLSRCHSLISIRFSHNSLDESCFSGLANVCSSLQRLDVSCNCLGNKGAAAIANVLKQCSLLLELNIASSHIGSAGAKSLAEALKSCTKLEKLVLHSNDLGTEGVLALAKSMEYWPNFTFLDISCNFLTSEAAKILAIGLKKCPSHSFQELQIGNNAIGDSGLNYLSSTLKKCTTLDISSNGISETGLTAISNAGNLKSIKQLDISGNFLDRVNLEVILAECASLSKLTLGHMKWSVQLLNFANVIRKNSLTLLTLNVSQSSQGFENLATALKSCMQLRHLNISHTPLSTSGSLAALSNTLSCLSQLTTLSLSFTQIEPEGTKLLANGLNSCTTLCKLFFDNNNIGNVGAAALSNVIANCHQLQVLDVSSNNIEYFGAWSLAKALEISGSLCELNISHNDITCDGERHLCEALKHCVSINSLNFSKSSLETLPHSLQSFVYLQKLQISHSTVNTNDLSKGLKCCGSLQELYVSSCGINSSGAIEIISSLSKTCYVLDISGNYIDSLTDLLSHINEDSSLSHLDFCKNSPLLPKQSRFRFSACIKLQALNITEIVLRDYKLSLLSEVLRRCTILQHLYIARNEFTIRELRALASVLKNFPMLQTLDVSGNNIGDEGAEILADCLQSNPILTTLCIYECGVSQTGLWKLNRALNSNTDKAWTRIEHRHSLTPVFESNTFC